MRRRRLATQWLPLAALVVSLVVGVTGCRRPASVERWGIEPLSLCHTLGGSALDFRYRVVDDKKAAPLFGDKLEPYLLAEKMALVMPDDERLGALRASLLNPPVTGKIYDVFFANGELPRGSRVTVVLGACKLDGVQVN